MTRLLLLAALAVAQSPSGAQGAPPPVGTPAPSVTPGTPPPGAPATPPADPSVPKATGALRALELPLMTDRLRRHGIPETDIRGLLDAAKNAGLPADAATDVVDEAAESVKEHGRVDNLGVFVKAQLDAGLRGKELAAAIRAEHVANGKGGGKPENAGPPADHGKHGSGGHEHGPGGGHAHGPGGAHGPNGGGGPGGGEGHGRAPGERPNAENRPFGDKAEGGGGRPEGKGGKMEGKGGTLEGKGGAGAEGKGGGRRGDEKESK